MLFEGTNHASYLKKQKVHDTASHLTASHSQACQLPLPAMSHLVVLVEWLEAKHDAEVVGQVVQAAVGGASGGQVAALEALLIQSEGALGAGVHLRSAAGVDGGRARVAAVGHGGQRAHHVERAGVRARERLQPHVGRALRVVVVVQQPLGHRHDLPGLHLERDVLRGAVLLGHARVHGAEEHAVELVGALVHVGQQHAAGLERRQELRLSGSRQSGEEGVGGLGHAKLQSRLVVRHRADVLQARR